MSASRRMFVLLKKHAPVVDHTGVTCTCMVDSQFDDPFRVRTAEEYAAHLAVELTDADDLAVLELPKGEPATDVYGKPITDYLHQGRTVMYTDPAGPVYRGKPYSGPYNVQMMRGASGQYWTPDGAEQFAAALVATARAARAAGAVER